MALHRCQHQGDQMPVSIKSIKIIKELKFRFFFLNVVKIFFNFYNIVHTVIITFCGHKQFIRFAPPFTVKFLTARLDSNAIIYIKLLTLLFLQHSCNIALKRIITYCDRYDTISFNPHFTTKFLTRTFHFNAIIYIKLGISFFLYVKSIQGYPITIKSTGYLLITIINIFYVT